jgi:hypothetical protein
MMSVKSKNVHVIETDYHSRLAFNIEEGKYIYRKDQFRYSNQEKIENRDIYITCDGFITENSWICHDSTLITKAKEVEYIDSEWKLIVFTTDVDLIKDGVQDIDDELLEWFVKNPSCEFVNIEKYHGINTSIAEVNYIGGDGSLSWQGRSDLRDYKIIIPKVEPKQHVEFINNNIDQFDKAIESFKQETLEEAAERYSAYSLSKVGFIEGAKWQQEQDKQEIQDLKNRLDIIRESSNNLINMIEQFKNK